MKQLLLAMMLMAAPVGLFAGVAHWLAPKAAVTSGLGDTTTLQVIVADVQALAAKGDLAGAVQRIADLETAWDDGEVGLRPLDPTEWGVLDGLIDHSLKALRAGQPDTTQVSTTLAAVAAELTTPGAHASTGSVQLVQGIAVTDDGGHPLPCETMINAVRAATPVPAKLSQVAAFVTQATERCNADDDVHADEFSAQALALLAH